jgi:hypothetical protein
MTRVRGLRDPREFSPSLGARGATITIRPTLLFYIALLGRHRSRGSRKAGLPGISSTHHARVRVWRHTHLGPLAPTKALAVSPWSKLGVL